MAITSQPLNASTATVTSYTIAEDPSGTDAPRRILVLGGTTLQATASLMPNTNYPATITRSLQSTTGSVLAAPYTWTFKTRPIVNFPLADGTALGIGYFGDLALAADSSGGLHAVYADSVNGDFIYAECAGQLRPRGQLEHAGEWIPSATSVRPVPSGWTGRAGSTWSTGATGWRRCSTPPALPRAPS